MSEKHIELAVEKAEEAFWQAVVECYPHITTGDLSPLMTMKFRDVATEAIEEWVWGNS